MEPFTAFLLLDSSSDSGSSERSSMMETSDASPNYAKHTGSSYAKTDNVQEKAGALRRRSSFKVTKGLTRMYSSKNRRKGLGGPEQKNKLKKLRSIKLSGLNNSRRSGTVYYQSSSSLSEADASPNYLKATKCSDVRKPNAAFPRNKPVIALRRTATLRPVRKLTKMASLRPKRPSTKTCSGVSQSPDSSVHRATCSSAIKDAKFPARAEIRPGGEVSGNASAMKVCPYSYCSLHGHRHAAAPGLKRLKSARRRVKTQRNSKVRPNGETDWGDSMKDVEEIQNAGSAGSSVVEKVEKEMTVEINSGPAYNPNGNSAQEEAGKVSEFNDLTEIQTTNHPSLASKGSLPHASDLSMDQQDGESLQAMKETYVDSYSLPTDSKEDIVGTTDAENHEIEGAEIDPDNREGNFNEPEATCLEEPEDLNSCHDPSSKMTHTMIDQKEEIPEDVEIVQELRDEKLQSLDDASLIDSETSTERPVTEEETATALSACTQEAVCGTTKEATTSGHEAKNQLQGVDKEEPIDLAPSATWSDLSRSKAMLEETAASVFSAKPACDTRKESTAAGGDVIDQLQCIKEVSPTDSAPETKLCSSFESTTMDEGNAVAVSVFLPEPVCDKPKESTVIGDDVIDQLQGIEEISPIDSASSTTQFNSSKSTAMDEEAASGVSTFPAEPVCGTEESSTVARDKFIDQLGCVDGVSLIGSATSPGQFDSCERATMEEETAAYVSVFPADLLCGTVQEPTVARNEFIDHVSGIDEVSSMDSPRSIGESNSSEITAMQEETAASGAAVFPAESHCATESTAVREKVDQDPQHSEQPEPDSTSDDSVKSSFGRGKFNGLWYLIYQHMVSDVAENGGLESPVYRASTEEKKEDGTKSPETNDSGYNSNSSEIRQVASPDEAGQQTELGQSDAIKLLQEAISKILAKSQKQSSVGPSSSGNRLLQKETKENNHEGMVESSSFSIKDGNEIAPHLEEEKLHADEMPKIHENAVVAAGKGPNQLASKRWSNLKKYILMKRFIRAMEKMRAFNRIARSSSSEVYLEQEKVSLRRQSIDERKNTYDWMLDYALRKVISELDPTQKRRVSLLVQAFETVNPVPGSESRIKPTGSYPSLVSRLNVGSSGQNEAETKMGSRDSSDVLIEEVRSTSPVPESKFYNLEQQNFPTCHKSQESSLRRCSISISKKDQNEVEDIAAIRSEESNFIVIGENQHSAESLLQPEYPRPCVGLSAGREPREVPFDGQLQKIQRELIPRLNSPLGNGDGPLNTCSSPANENLRSETPEGYVLSGRFERALSLSSVNEAKKDQTAASESGNRDVELTKLRESKEIPKPDGEVTAAIRERSGSSQPEECATEGDEPQLDNKKYKGLWFLIYEHMVSGLATEEGTQPSSLIDDGNKKGGDGANEELVDLDMPASSPYPSEPSRHVHMNQRMETEEIRRSKIEAIKLVQQAIDEILLPENEDTSPDNQYTGGETSLVDEPEDRICSKLGSPPPTSTHSEADSCKEVEKATEECMKSTPDIQVASADIQLMSDGAAQQGGKTTICKEENQSGQGPRKNWNNLRKVILLKRFVKAIEKVRAFNPRQPRYLTLEPDREPEKVSLKHQDMEERRNAEEYLLDYALRQVVSRLTPARKKKVHLLVEAFETITPTFRK